MFPQCSLNAYQVGSGTTLYFPADRWLSRTKADKALSCRLPIGPTPLLESKLDQSVAATSAQASKVDQSYATVDQSYATVDQSYAAKSVAVDQSYAATSVAASVEMTAKYR